MVSSFVVERGFHQDGGVAEIERPFRIEVVDVGRNDRVGKLLTGRDGVERGCGALRCGERGARYEKGRREGERATRLHRFDR